MERFSVSPFDSLAPTAMSDRKRSRSDLPERRTGDISGHSLTVRCAETVTRTGRKLQISIGLRPEDVQHRDRDFVVLLRRFWAEATFPGGEVVFRAPDGSGARELGQLSRGQLLERGWEAGADGELAASSFKLISKLRETRKRQKSLGASSVVDVLDLITSPLSKQPNIVEWLVRMVAPATAAEARLLDPEKVAEVLDFFVYNLDLEAHTRETPPDPPTRVCIRIDLESFFVLHKNTNSRLGRFFDSLLLWESLRQGRLQDLRRRMADSASFECEVL